MSKQRHLFKILARHNEKRQEGGVGASPPPPDRTN